MDTVTFATITAALTVLGTEAAKGMASEAGTNAWEAVKRLLGLTEGSPNDSSLAREVAERLYADPVLIPQALEIVKDESPLVGHIQVSDKGKVVIASRIDTVNM